MPLQIKFLYYFRAAQTSVNKKNILMRKYYKWQLMKISGKTGIQIQNW